MKVYNQQIKKLNQNIDDKKDVILSKEKLQQLGRVDSVRILNAEQQEMLRRSEIQNFITWRAVWNGNSISTPCRLVFDAPQPATSGWDSNDILVKGKNNMNILVETVIRCQYIRFPTNIKKTYISVDDD